MGPIRSLAIAAVAGSVLLGASALAACPPEGRSRASMSALADTGFALADAEERNALALALVDCLAHPDPRWRDDIAYTALATWVRQANLEPSTLLAIHGRLARRLAVTGSDRQGFRQPFAALMLAQTVAADRAKPFLDEAAIPALVDIACDWFESIRDYRGFDPQAGWRHAVAHGADLLAQLAVHPRTSSADLDRIVTALATQIAPASGHSWIHGEAERLALPLLRIAARGIYTTAQWRDWFAGIAAVPEGGNLYGSRESLARRHNLQAVLLVLYVNVNESDDADLRATLLPAVVDALRSLQ